MERHMYKPPDDTPETETRSRPPRDAPAPHRYYDDDSTGYQPYDPDADDADDADDENDADNENDEDDAEATDTGAV